MHQQKLDEITQQALFDFLEADLNLSQTFLDTAEIACEEANREHSDALMNKVKNAIGVVRRNVTRIESVEARLRIEAKLQHLETRYREMLAS